MPATPPLRSTCVVVSHYNAWPTDQLIRLLDQTLALRPDRPFHTRVVVNRALDKDLVLPSRHAHVDILYRGNAGYNIGAWDLGWRDEPAFDAYLFLQEECVLRGRGWLDAFIHRLRDPCVGLVGESLVWERPWRELEATQHRPDGDLFRIDGLPVDHFACYYEHMRRQGVERGATGAHLQSLIWAARRDVLEKIGPFPVGLDYGEAVSAEILVSKKVQTLGLAVCQVGWLPFTRIEHPQWKTPWPKRVWRQTVMRWMPSGIRTRLLMLRNGWRRVRQLRGSGRAG